jgi:hypothetical protein
VHPAGVAVAVKATVSGAAPEVGFAVAVQERLQLEVTVTVPVLVHARPPTEAVIVQEKVPPEL